MILKEMIPYIDKNIIAVLSDGKSFKGLLTNIESDLDTTSGDYEAIVSQTGDFCYTLPIGEIIKISEIPKMKLV